MATAIIQARMGSTRLPGKVMLPLEARHVLHHVVERVAQASLIDDVVVATSSKRRDDILARFVPDFGAKLHRGSEANVLERLFDTAVEYDADTIVRITADCPLVEPSVIDSVIGSVEQNSVDYASNVRERTFPRGLDIEAFTFDSFREVRKNSTDTRHKEHVTPYYRENPHAFELVDVTSEEVFDDPRFKNRDDLRLTLDEANDYDVLRKIYQNVPYDDILPIRGAIQYVDENDLMDLNESIEQKEL
jgi:spore coat polysaccharide biosynthesis protein SpsF